MRDYYIRPIPLVCNSHRDMSFHTYRMNYGRPVVTADYVWFIEGSETKIVIDAGASAEMYHTRGNHEEMDVQSLEDGLGKLDLRPSDIEIVILTHLHWDHVGVAWKFKKAKFIVQKAEVDFVSNLHPLAAPSYDRKLFTGLNFSIIEGEQEIIKGLKVMPTPGHTPGGQSVIVDTPKGQAIITGFCCVLANFDPPPAAKSKGWLVAAPGGHTDALEAYDSTLRVKQMTNIIVATHDSSYLDKDRIP